MEKCFILHINGEEMNFNILPNAYEGLDSTYLLTIC